jgi:DNA-binding response OmpR family regulator
MLPSILVCGNDPTLLLTRKLVLEHAGFRVETVLGPSRLLEHAGECVLLCSSLSESEQLEAIGSTREHRPGAKILVVGGEQAEVDDNVLTIPIYAKAEALIENARLLWT